MSYSTYIVGIDLGTTNCAVAWVKPGEGEPERDDFPVSQLVGPGQLEKRPTLPSFLYIPGHEMSQDSLQLPWDEVATFAVGTFARDEGGKVPHRLISSAKSWLSQEGVDRRSAILPWKAQDVQQMSPVQASASYLKHLRDAWRFAYPDEPMKEQEVVLTVPASFDAVARELTAEAARVADLPNLTLLEEPQAAFYAWLDGAGDGWREKIGVGDLILVCDIGGGTTDFSLITVVDQEGDLGLERVAVGEHLLLGGDNMDLALAVAVQNRLRQEGTKIDSWQFQVLTHGCRAAKEALLGSQPPQEVAITIPGRGSKLVGGAVQAELKLADVEALLDGFFPRVEASDHAQRKRHGGLTEIGLPYESDPAVTRQLARFLDGKQPTAVLFNGGVLKAAMVRQRIVDVLDSWLDKPVRLLEGGDLELAVARGAARYGLSRRGVGIRIRGGLSKTYYIGVELARPAVPGMPPPIKAVCVAPRGMEEGTRTDVPEQKFGLVVGESVEFPFLASTEREDAPGTTLEDWEDEVEQISTVAVSLKPEKGREAGVVPVKLESVVTEVGTLELWCHEADGEGRWKLEFEVRDQDAPQAEPVP
ncbi:MAG: Hsp70 family protein, partial [Candidatus Eremiobacterota bacterium]